MWRRPIGLKCVGFVRKVKVAIVKFCIVRHAIFCNGCLLILPIIIISLRLKLDRDYRVLAFVVLGL